MKNKEMMEQAVAQAKARFGEPGSTRNRGWLEPNNGQIVFDIIKKAGDNALIVCQALIMADQRGLLGHSGSISNQTAEDIASAGASADKVCMALHSANEAGLLKRLGSEVRHVIVAAKTEAHETCQALIQVNRENPSMLIHELAKREGLLNLESPLGQAVGKALSRKAPPHTRDRPFESSEEDIYMAIVRSKRFGLLDTPYALQIVKAIDNPAQHPDPFVETLIRAYIIGLLKDNDNADYYFKAILSSDSSWDSNTSYAINRAHQIGLLSPPGSESTKANFDVFLNINSSSKANVAYQCLDKLNKNQLLTGPDAQELREALKSDGQFVSNILCADDQKKIASLCEQKLNKSTPTP